MNRELTRRETVLLLILVVLVIFLGYFKLIFEPIQDQVAQYQDTTSQEQSELEQDLILLTRKQEMQRKIEEVRASGEERTIPQYDNSRRLMLDLHRILDSAVDYSLDFSQSTTQDSYIVLRPVTMSFQTHTYAQARAIVDALSGGQRLVDDVIAETGLSTGKLLSSLTMLELKGIIKRLPGKRIVLSGK